MLVLLAALVLLADSGAGAAAGEAADTAATATTEGGAFLGALVGAFGGLIAILLGALYNAKLNRQRDTRLRNQEIRGLCRAFAAELLICAKKLRATAGSVEKAIKEKEPLKIENFRDHYNPVTDIYQANLDKIGLFGELARDVVKVYSHLAVARGDNREAVKKYFSDEGELNPMGINVELFWLVPAKKAEDLARRLEAYEPPDD
jgi:hypothetical protein